MKINNLLTDEAILSEIGERISQRRLDLQLTQAEVAEQAGVAKRTLERIESGASAQVVSLIRIFRALDALPGLDRIIPELGQRPMDLLKAKKGKKRKRASKSRHSGSSGKPWSWKDK